MPHLPEASPFSPFGSLVDRDVDREDRDHAALKPGDQNVLGLRPWSGIEALCVCVCVCVLCFACGSCAGRIVDTASMYRFGLV